ncbi:MAG: DUF4292 domain-containing protein [Ignavibacteriales bacterium]|nr:DUF4292 domain-containing protein [Ignavibacteriales bacterium]
MQCAIGNFFRSEKLLFIVLCASLLFSCRTTKEITKNFSREEIISSVQENAPSISTMRAKGTMTVENEEESFNLSFELEYKNDDSLLLRLYGPFGISAGILQLTRDSFQLFNAIDNRLIIASLHDKAFETLLHFSADFSTIQKIFFDENLNEVTSKNIELSNENDEIFLASRMNNGTEKFWFNTEEQTIERYQKLNPSNEPMFEKKLKRFSSINEKRFPYWIRSSFPKENRMITISYSDVELNVFVLCSFTIPKSAEIIRR